MIEKLKTLAKMQLLDDKVGRCRVLKQELPKQLNELIDAVDVATVRMLEIETERAEISKKQRAFEADIKVQQDQSRKYGTQLSDIKTNKEYKALNSEIAFLNTKISEIESQLLELMDLDTEVKTRLDAAKADLEAAEQRKREKEGDLRQQIEALDGEIETLRNKRNDMARTLPESLIRQYGNLIKHKENLAVVKPINGGCGGCGIIIRPQIKIEMQLQKKIILCENCGRILINPFDDIK